jgi:hypothetical protein
MNAAALFILAILAVATASTTTPATTKDQYKEEFNGRDGTSVKADVAYGPNHYSSELKMQRSDQTSSSKSYSYVQEYSHEPDEPGYKSKYDEKIKEINALKAK